MSIGPRLLNVLIISGICFSFSGCIQAKMPSGQLTVVSNLINTNNTRIRFTDVTKKSNILYQHYNGAFVINDGKTSRYMPETMGPGIVLFDYDNDEDLDVFITNSSDFNSHTDDRQTTSQLYRNEGNLRFVDVSVQAGLSIHSYGMGAIATDFDGDRHQDILITTWGGVLLYKNLGNGTFRDVTTELGLKMEPWRDSRGKKGPNWSTGAVFFDADGDKDLDLLVINYVKWSPEADIYTTFDTLRKGYTSPRSYEGNTPRLFEQEKGVFKDITRSSGIYNPNAKSLGVALWDFDSDGRMDIIIANDTQRNFYYHNLGNGLFEEKGISSGVSYDETGNVRAGMGIDIADYLNDGSAGVAIGNFSREPTSLFKLARNGSFLDVSQESNVSGPTYLALTFGLVFADMDLDGWQDLVMANGHIEPHIQDVEPEIRYRQPLILLGNLHDGRFADWSDTAGPVFQTPLVGRGLAVGDLDQDGDLDMVVTENNGPVHILRNDTNISSRHYLRVLLHGQPPNTNAIGAKLKLISGDLTQQRIVRTGSSYLSQSEFTQTFGLGDRKEVDKLIITWPSGKQIEFHFPDVNTTLVAYEKSRKILHP